MAFGLFKKKKGAAEEAPKKSGFLNLKIKEVVREIDDAISIHFEQPTSGDIQYQSGQFFTVVADINGKEERRAYSLCSSPFVDASPAVTVKRVDGGLMSNYLNDNAKAGEELSLMDPIGNFTTSFDENNNRHIVLFGGGSGITPLISIAKSALNQEPNSKISLIYANKSTDSIIFKDKLDEMVENAGGRFSLVHVLENKPEDMDCYSGWLTEDIIKESLNKLPQEAPASTEFFMCGPGPMMDIVETSLNNLGIDKAQVNKESFTSSLDKGDDAEGSEEIIAREVTIIYDDEEFKFTVEPGETILEKGLDEDIDLPFSCQSGLCTACRGKCKSGKVKMLEDEGLSEAEIDEGYVLPCVSHPLTDGIVIEIG